MGEPQNVAETMLNGAVDLLLDLVSEYGQCQSAATCALLAGAQDDVDRNVESAAVAREAIRVELERVYRVVFAAKNFAAEARIGGSIMRAGDRRVILDLAIREWQEASRG